MSESSSSIFTFEFEALRGMTPGEHVDYLAIRERRLRASRSVASRSVADESVSSDDRWTVQSGISMDSDGTLVRWYQATRQNIMTLEAEREDEPYHLQLHCFVHWTNDLFTALNDLRTDIGVQTLQRRHDLSTAALRYARRLYYLLHRHTSTENDLFSFQHLRHAVLRYNLLYAQRVTGTPEDDIMNMNREELLSEELLSEEGNHDRDIIAMRWNLGYFHPYTAFQLWARMSPLFLSFITAGRAAYGGVAVYGKQDDVIVVLNLSDHHNDCRRDISRFCDDFSHWFSYQQMHRDSFSPLNLIHPIEFANSDFGDGTDIESLDSFDLTSSDDEEDDDGEYVNGEGVS